MRETSVWASLILNYDKDRGMFFRPLEDQKKTRHIKAGGLLAILAVLPLVISGCAQQKKKDNFSVIDTRPVPQPYVYNDQTYTVLLKPAGSGSSTVEVAGMAYSLTDNPTDRTRAEQVGARYLAGRGQCGAGVAPFPVSGSQVFNSKHEFWSIGYRCS